MMGLGGYRGRQCRHIDADIDVLADFEGQKMSASWRAKTPLFNQAEGQDGDDNNDIIVGTPTPCDF
jgi:hypothetical protein